jgi:glycosyltransferase involved in cell wall biosynthesis
MSTYNNAAYLRDAVDSILNQTYRDFELIVINDGSKDNTEAILREYEQQDCRVRVVSRGNKGLTDSLNEGVDLARGRYVARMDADDIAYRDRFAVQMAYMAAHPECVCCGTFVRLVDPFGSSLGDLERPTTHEEIDEVLMTGSGWTMVHPTCSCGPRPSAASGGTARARRVRGPRFVHPPRRDRPAWRICRRSSSTTASTSAASTKTSSIGRSSSPTRCSPKPTPAAART